MTNGDQFRRLFEQGHEDALYAAAEECLWPEGAEIATVPRWVLEALIARQREHMARMSSGKGRTARWVQRRAQDFRDALAHQMVVLALRTGRHSTFDDEVFRHVAGEYGVVPTQSEKHTAASGGT